VGDSPDVYLHRVTGGARVTFSPIMKLSLSPYIAITPTYTYAGYGLYPSYQSNNAVPASFSTAFSADGSKLAVASQDGVVVVWDVRSTKPLKVIQTDKERSSSTPTGSASGWIYDSPFDWGRSQARAPGWGVRSVKFSPKGVGREVLTFTEVCSWVYVVDLYSLTLVQHTSLLHVIDATTFETEEIIRVPAFDSPPPSRPHSARQRAESPSTTRPASLSTVERTHVHSSPLPPPPRIMLFSGALEETFRIPSADSTGRRWSHLRSAAYDDGEDIVVIPPLGDREVDEDVRRLFEGRHSVTLRMRDSSLDDSEGGSEGPRGDGRLEDEMDIDELDADCISSYSPSRAASPAPSSAAHAQSSSAPASSSLSRYDPARRASLLERRESSSPYMSRRGSSQALHRRRTGSGGPSTSEIDQDLAGMCFDPSGEYIYVGAVNGIAEWKVRGAEQRWWSEPSFA
jgi:hypothetical protein